MGAATVVLRLHESDPEAFKELHRAIPEDMTLIETRRFDGIAVTEAVVLVTMSTLAVLRAWLVERARSGRATTVILNGLELKGYKVEEVEAILSAISDSIGDPNEPPPGPTSRVDGDS